MGKHEETYFGRPLSLVLCGATIGGLAAGAFGLLCATVYWAVTGGDTAGNPFRPFWFLLAGAVAGVVVGVCRAVDRSCDGPQPPGWGGEDFLVTTRTPTTKPFEETPCADSGQPEGMPCADSEQDVERNRKGLPPAILRRMEMYESPNQGL